MGLFTRKDSASDKKGEARRPAVPSEIQMAELRARARRRLAGSIVLVLAAVIILPMVLDSRTPPAVNDVSVNIPGRDSPYQPVVSDPSAQAQPSAQAGASASATQAQPPGQGSSVVTPAAQPAAVAANSAASTTTPSASPATPVTPPAATSASNSTPTPATSTASPRAPSRPDAGNKPAESKPPETRQASPARTDDGAVALALLEGRKPSTAAAPAKPPASSAGGNYVLQVAAYGVQADAQSRQAQLRQSGITNTYIEPYNSGGKSLYRLRVGPFPSREAAQAAQARLRALGYNNDLIAPK